MAITTVDTFVEAVQDSPLLSPAQMTELSASLRARFPQPKLLARHLLELGWLTPYQVNELFQGRGRGLVLGQYLLLDRLGAGATGQTFKARHRDLNRLVAVKIIRPDLLVAAGAKERLRQTVAIASRLSHPNLLPPNEVGQAGDLVFLIASFLEGMDLERVVKKSGPLPVDKACDYARQAALGLHHAHQYRLVHGNLKGSNLLVAEKDGGVRILDIGLGSLRTASIAAGADLRGLGAVLHHLLTGKTLQTPEAAQPWEGVAQLVAVVGKRLTSGGFQSAAEAAAALESLVSPGSGSWSLPLPSEPNADSAETPAGTGAPATPWASLAEIANKETPPRPHSQWARWRRRWLIPSGIAAVFVILAGLTLAYFGRRPEQKVVEAKKNQPAAIDPARAEMKELLAKREDPRSDLAELRQGLLDLRLRYPGSPEARRAAELLWRLPTPLDPLDGSTIPKGERLPDQPKELVALLGTQRWRHASPVRAIAINSAKLVASAGDDRLIHIWDLETGRELAALAGHSSTIYSLAFAPAGNVLASSSHDGTVRLWDPSAGKELATLSGHTRPVCGVAFSPNGQVLASVAVGDGNAKVPGEFKLWHPGPRKERGAFAEPSNSTYHEVAFSPVGGLMATAYGKRKDSGQVAGEIRIREAETGKELKNLQGHEGNVTSLAFAADGRTLASGGEDGVVNLWDATTGETRRALRGHGGPILALAYSPDGSILASASDDGTVRLWTADTGKPSHAFRRHLSGVATIAFTPDGAALISGGMDGMVKLWDVRTGQEREPRQAQNQWAVCVAFAPGDAELAVGNRAMLVKLWHATTIKEKATLAGHTAEVAALAYSPDGRTVASACADKTVALWDVATGDERATLLGHGGPVEALAFSPHGQTLATGSTDGLIKMWDSITGKERDAFKGHTASVYLLAFAPDGKALVSAGADETTRIWDMVAGKEQVAFRRYADPVLSASWAPDGKTLAIGCRDRSVKLWDLSAKTVKTFAGGEDGHKDEVIALTFVPDGQNILSLSRDGRLIRWSLAGKKVKEWLLAGSVHRAAFSSTGRHVALVRLNGTVLIYRLVAPVDFVVK